MKTAAIVAISFLATGCFSDAPFEGSHGSGDGSDASGSDAGADASGGPGSGSGPSSGSATGSGSGDGSGSSESSESGEGTGGGTSGSGSSSGGTSSGTSGTGGSDTDGESGSSDESSDSGAIDPDVPADPVCADNCAVAFDGGSGRTGDTTLIRDTLAETLSAEIWLRRTGDVINEYILDTRDADGRHGIALYQGSGPLMAEIHAGSFHCAVESPSLNTMEQDRWHHVLVEIQYDGPVGTTWLSLYANGYLSGRVKGTMSSPCAIGQLTSPIRIGEAFDGSSRLRFLEVDNIRITSQIFAYDGFSPDPTPSVQMQTRALWFFDEGSGDIAIDEVAGLELSLSNHRWVNH